MRIERIEIFVTDLTTVPQRRRSTGTYDTGERALQAHTLLKDTVQ